MDSRRIVLFLAFDPGAVTGFAAAEWVERSNTLTILDLEPIRMHKEEGKFQFSSPPIPLFKAFHKEVADIVNLQSDSLVDVEADEVAVAIENYRGGSGTDIQNSVNKLIGIVMGAQMEAQSLDTGVLYHDLKLYDNSSRNRFKARVVSALEGKGAVSEHSRDALAHLFHRVEQLLTPEQYAALKVHVASNA